MDILGDWIGHRKKKQWNIISIKRHRSYVNLWEFVHLNKSDSCQGGNAKNPNDFRAKCKCCCIGLWRRAVFCTGAICWVWIMAAKYIAPLTLYTDMTNWSGQGIGESTAIWLTFPHGLIEYTSSQFPSAPLFSLPVGYTALPRCYF